MIRHQQPANVHGNIYTTISAPRRVLLLTPRNVCQVLLRLRQSCCRAPDLLAVLRHTDTSTANILYMFHTAVTLKVIARKIVYGALKHGSGVFGFALSVVVGLVQIWNRLAVYDTYLRWFMMSRNQASEHLGPGHTRASMCKHVVFITNGSPHDTHTPYSNTVYFCNIMERIFVI